MAPRPPLLSLRDAHITFGGPALFAGVSLGIGRGDRLCLVGRNGCGKSTLMKALAGEVGLDGGERFAAPGVRVAYMPQEVHFGSDETAAGYVRHGLEGLDPAGGGGHLVDEALAGVGLDGARPAGTLSGGEGRRAALARALVGDPDVLLLDEPTNHLDLPMIEWLEERLARFAGGIVLVSHDRALLGKVARATLWLDRGTLRRNDAGFAEFADWSARVLAAEESEARRRNVKIAADLKWLREGLSARRRRNQGRLRRLMQMREERRRRVPIAGRVALTAKASERGARLVIDAEDIGKSFHTPDGPLAVVEGFTTRVMRGDRVGFIGPNGAGKTTLLRMLCGDLAPDTGRLRLGPGVVPLYFDQKRETLDPEMTLWRTLVEGGGDQVMVRGRPRHVVSYLRDYLFEERQALSPVKSLSGGERNRLLLARLLARPGNLLVLDEPTNDLDMETLDLLEEVLGDYDGTLLVVSHDRDFLDRIVTSIIAVEGGGDIVEYAGGYSDYLIQRGDAKAKKETRPRRSAGKAAGRARKAPEVRMRYKDRHELERLPGRIDALAGEIGAIEATLADPALFAADRAAYDASARRLEQARAELAAAEERWLELESLREEIEARRRD